MGKRARNRDHIDPEYRRWCRKYPRFPGVAECVRLIRAGKARRAWSDIIAFELAENAARCLPDLIEAFRADASGAVSFFVLMALEDAKLPESVPFLGEVLREGNPSFVCYVERTLRAINTPESRSVLWQAGHSKPDVSP
jgi:hypothetical protein